VQGAQADWAANSVGEAAAMLRRRIAASSGCEHSSLAQSHPHLSTTHCHIVGITLPLAFANSFTYSLALPPSSPSQLLNCMGIRWTTCTYIIDFCAHSLDQLAHSSTTLCSALMLLIYSDPLNSYTIWYVTFYLSSPTSLHSYML
jgi:hypothetical protein